jgi:hypothetical protein
VAALSLAFAAPASATTFCVPNTSFAACPAGSTTAGTVDAAITTNASDTVADKVYIAAGVFTDPDTFDVAGTDDLEIVGAGPGTGAGATRLTSSDNGNQFVVNLNGRAVTVRDLTIVIPASFPDSAGDGLLTNQDTIQNVDIESQNGNAGLGSDGVVLGAGTTFSDGAVYASNSGGETGRILDAFTDNGVVTGAAEVTRTTVANAASGAFLNEGSLVVTIRRSLIVNPTAYGVFASTSAIVNVYNTVIRTNGTASPLESDQFSDGSTTALLSARHVTMVRSGGVDNEPAVEATVTGAHTGGINLVVRDSIIRGFADSYGRSGGSGTANLAISYSDFPNTGTNTGGGSLSVGTGNIDVDPLFADAGAFDFHLLAGSPAIDTADPNPSPALLDDFDGAVRPVDGNADGTARRDRGAYEYQLPVVTPPSTPTGTASPPPTVTKKKKCKKRKRAASTAKKKKCKKKRK